MNDQQLSSGAILVGLAILVARIALSMWGSTDPPSGSRPEWVAPNWGYNRLTAPLWRDPMLMLICVGGTGLIGGVLAVDLLLAGQQLGFAILLLTLPTPWQIFIYLPSAWRARRKRP